MQKATHSVTQIQNCFLISNSGQDVPFPFLPPVHFSPSLAANVFTSKLSLKLNCHSVDDLFDALPLQMEFIYRSSHQCVFHVSNWTISNCFRSQAAINSDLNVCARISAPRRCDAFHPLLIQFSSIVNCHAKYSEIEQHAVGHRASQIEPVTRNCPLMTYNLIALLTIVSSNAN